MIKKLFTLHSQKLNYYIAYLSSCPISEGLTRKELIKLAKEYLVSDLLKAVSIKMTREHTGSIIYSHSSIELDWKAIDEEFRTDFLVIATVNAEDGQPNAIED